MSITSCNALVVNLPPPKLGLNPKLTDKLKKTEILLEKGYFMMNSIGDHFPVF